MQVVVTGIAQGLSFETGEEFNHLSLLLPDGTRIVAAVDGDAVAKITTLFIKGGSQASKVAVQAVMDDATAPDPVVPTEYDNMMPRAAVGDFVYREGDFAPGMVSGGDTGYDDETVSTFGGDGGEQDPMLDAVGSQLQQAEARLARAVGNSESMNPEEIHSVVAQLSSPERIAPVPNVMRQPPTQPRRLSGPKVQADAQGNPIISGPGFVDPRSLMGGNTDGEEDVGQV